MAINVSQAFHRTSANAIDESLTLTKAQMVAVNDNLMPPKYFTICQDDGKIYLYDKTNEADVQTGKFRVFEGGSAIDPNPTSGSENAVSSGGVYTALSGKVDAVQGKGLSTEDFTTAEKTKLDGIDLSNYVPTSQKGENNGVATLGSNGKIPMSQIPSGLDEIINGYRNPTNGLFYEDAEYTTAITGGTGIIYFDVPREVSSETIGGLYWRWNGTAFVTFGDALVLGEVTGTAYDGGKGKANRDAIGDLTTLTTTAKSSLVAAVNELNQSLALDTTPTQGSTNGVQSGGVYTALQGKVDTVQGKGLSENDYSDAEKTKVANSDAHISAKVTDANGVHDFKVDTTGSRAKILYKSGNSWVEIALGDIFRVSTIPTASADNLGSLIQYTGNDANGYVKGYFYECVSDGESTPTYSWVSREVQDEVRKTELPTASVDYLGMIYMYVGQTTVDYKKGFFYECILDGSTYKWTSIRVQAGGGQTIQYDTMPTASGENEDSIIQYVGLTTADYTNGYFYKCVAKGTDPETYEWEQTNVQPDVDISGKEDKFRYTTMPTASEDNVGQVVQYLGESTQIYTQGTSYKCVAKGTTPETYEWVAFGGVKDDRIGDEISNIKVRIDNGFRPYIVLNPSVAIPSFSNATFEQIKEIANAYYNGNISLQDIQESWHIGDSKQLSISAMEATGVSETHAAQTVTMYLADFNHDTLTNAINGKTKSLLTFSFILNETGQMNTSGSDSAGTSHGNEGGWKESARRTWCNNVCIEALPSALQSIVKRIIRITDKGSCSEETNTTNDLLFIPSSIELVGEVLEPSGFSTYKAGADSGIQYEMYKTDYPAVNTVYTSVTNGGFKSNWSYSYYSSYWLTVKSDKTGDYSRGDYEKDLFIHGCI